MILPLLPDNPSDTLREAEDGDVLTAFEGVEGELSVLARPLPTSDAGTFFVFPQTDGNGGYHTLHIIPHAPA